MTILASYLAVTLCLICLCAVFVLAYRCRAWAIDCAAAQAATKKASVLHVDIVDLNERVDGCEKSLKRLHSRAGMREVRERRHGSNGAVPDWRDDPEGYRLHMESQLGISGPKK